MPGKSSKQREAKKEGKKMTDTFIFPNGEKYDGEYVECGNGLIERSGEGTHNFASGLVYKGGWVKDKMNGTGEMIHPNGSAYKGDFLNNEYHGNGTFGWPDGSTFTGQFVNNRVSGNGEFKDAAGCVWIGDFSEDSRRLLKLKLL